MNKDLINRLKSLGSEIDKLEKEKVSLIDELLNSIYLTPKQWSEKFVDKEKFFNECMATTFVYRTFITGGSNYFGWTSEDKQIKDFEIFKEHFLKSKDRCFLCESKKMFFQYQYAGHNACVRSKEQFTEKFIENNKLIYRYKWTNYDGFGNSCGTGHQRFQVDLKDLKIFGYNDSNQRYDAGFQISKFLKS